MANVLIVGGGGSGGLSDDTTAKSPQVLEEYTYIGNDTDDEVGTGTMKNLTARTEIEHSSSNQTKVIVGDEVYITDNTDGKNRLQVRYIGDDGFITSNTLFGIETSKAATAGGLTTAKLIQGQSAFGLSGTATSDGTLAANKMLSGTIGYSKGTRYVGNIASQGALTLNPGTTTKTGSVSGKYMTGNITVPAITLPANYVKKGQVITFPDGSKVTGTFEGYVASINDIYNRGSWGSGFSQSNYQRMNYHNYTTTMDEVPYPTFYADRFTLSVDTSVITRGNRGGFILNKAIQLDAYSTVNVSILSEGTFDFNEGFMAISRVYTDNYYFVDSTDKLATTSFLQRKPNTEYTYSLDISSLKSTGYFCFVHNTNDYNEVGKTTIYRIWLT